MILSGVWVPQQRNLRLIISSQVQFLTLNSPTSSTFNASILKVIVLNESENILNTALERLGNLESIRVLPTQAGTNKAQLVTEYQTSSIRLQNGQYFAKLPWKVDHAPLPLMNPLPKEESVSASEDCVRNPPS